MKVAVFDNENIIWGLGNTQDEALHDAYNWLNQDGDQWESYSEFTESECFDGLKIRDITDAAAEQVEEYGGNIQRSRNPLVFDTGVTNNNVIMTQEEYDALYPEEE